MNVIHGYGMIWMWYTESEPTVSSPTAPWDIGGGVGPHNLLRGGLGGGRGQAGLEPRNVPEGV